MWDKPLVHKLIADGATNIIELAHPRAAWEVGPAHPSNELNDRAFISRLAGSGGGQNWWGAPSGEEAIKRMHEGWPEGLSNIRQALSMLDVPVLPKRKRTRYGMDGEVDIERFLFTEPEPFRQHARILAPVIKLTVDVGGNFNVSAETLKWRGAATVIIADILTNAGFSVEIIAMTQEKGKYPGFWNGHNTPQTTVTLLKLKDAQAPMNLSILAGTLFTTAAFRIAMWRAWYHTPWPVETRHGYNRPIPESLYGDIAIPASVQSQITAQKFLAELPTCKRSDLKKFILKGGN